MSLAFTPLFSCIVDSSLWEENDGVVKVFMTMLAKQDRDYVVRGSAYNIAKWSNKKEADVLDALAVLSAPDTKRLEKQEFEGRRIERVEDGWLILNGALYAKRMRLLFERARKTKWERDNRTGRKHKPLNGEVAAMSAVRDGRPEGDDYLTGGKSFEQSRQDALSERNMPCGDFEKEEASL
jgi:hypothetical protein